LRRTWSWTHAAAGIVLLVLIPTYIQLSVSVMVGLPAISLAMLSLLCLTVWHERARRRWLILSAALLAISVMVKLFTVVLVPAILLGLLVIPARGADPAGTRRPAIHWRALGLWFVVFGATLGALVLVWVGPSHLGQLVESHLGAQGIAYFAGETLRRHTRDLWPLFVLAAIGAVISIRRGAWSSLYYAAWVVLAGALLAVNTPVWYHQQLLVAVPASVLAGVGLVEPIRLAQLPGGRRWGRALLALAVAGLGVMYLLWAGPRLLGKLRPDLPNLTPSVALGTREYDLLPLIEYFDPGGSQLVTDRPMFAYRSRRSVPPAMANLSQKVLRSGVVTEGQIIEMIREHDAPVVLLGRFDLPEVEAYLDEGYDQVYGYIDLRLFVKPK
jgi:4-amino-4-deoxy-L-arabinose transferase-like glycosyltransferase